MSDSFNKVDILEHILNHLSSNSLEDCKNLIEKTVFESEKNDAALNAHDKAISCLNILLQFYAKTVLKGYKCSTELSFGPILKFINEKLTHGSPTAFESQIFEIVQNLHQIMYWEPSKINFFALSQFHSQNVAYIDKYYTLNNCDVEKLKLRLEIMCIMCTELLTVPNVKGGHAFYSTKDPDPVSRINLHAVISKVILQGNDDIFKKTLLFGVTHLVAETEDYELIAHIWRDISNSIVTNKDMDLSRILLTLSYSFDLCFFKGDLYCKTNLMTTIFQDTNFWNILQSGLRKADAALKKQALYLLKGSIDLLFKTDENILCVESSPFNRPLLFLWWDASLKIELASLYREMIVIMEYLNEQQVHIIKPMFSMVDGLVSQILKVGSDSGKSLSFSWIILIHDQILQHESIQVVKWGLESLFKFPIEFFLNEELTKEVVSLLVPALNNINLFYNEGIEISKNLTGFCNKFIHESKTKEVFFNAFLENLCNLVWSPEPLFFVTHGLAQTQDCHVWKMEEINQLQLFIRKAFKTFGKTVRTAIQCELLSSLIGLTNVLEVPLGTVVSLMSDFQVLGCLKRGTVIWVKVINWIKKSYSWQDGKNCLDVHLEKVEKTRDKVLPAMLMLLADAYRECGHGEKQFFVRNALTATLEKFRDVNKRLYYNKTSLDNILSVICGLLEENSNVSLEERSPAADSVVPFFPHIMHYIKNEIVALTKIEHFDTALLYIKSFECLLKYQCIGNDHLNSAVNEIISEMYFDFDVIVKPIKSKPALRLYCWMKLLKAIIKILNNPTNPFELKLDGFYERILSTVNDRLQKNVDDETENSADSSAVWGKMNSEYLECKWVVLEYFVKSGQKVALLNCDQYLNLCLEGVQLGNAELSFPVMSLMKDLLRGCDKSKVQNVVNFFWKAIAQTRKTDLFKKLVKGFVEMLFSGQLLALGYYDVHLMYVDLIFSETSVGVVNVFMDHILYSGLHLEGNPLLVHILSKALIYGPIMRKDEKLTLSLHAYISSLDICKLSEWDSSNVVRGKAVAVILSFDRTKPKDRDSAWEIIEKLIDINDELNKNKVRYFGDSQVHRIKHRLMQALLILQPLIDDKMEALEKLADWLYDALLTENAQPSVRYMQEWLLIRILIKHGNLLEVFWMRLKNAFLSGAKARGFCSLTAISYHLCKLVDPRATSPWVGEAVMALLPPSMDQQFEMRLYAQVVLKKLFELSESRGLKDVFEKYGMINECVLKSIEKGCKGNALKNFKKLDNDFYLNAFDPLEDFSLRTIFLDLPRLTNVGQDEWISTDILASLPPVRDSSAGVKLDNDKSALKDIECAKWSVENCSPVDYEPSERALANNYQKKMIPQESGSSTLDFATDFTVLRRRLPLRKDGLIVVAALIDRIPNLGGLARTCEIFGASEYVVGSLKYLEDKQFASLSVTAEKWIPVKEVKKENLLEYLLEMKKEGYSIIGAEQALKSVTLNGVKFPKKSLILLGNEKEGIPPNLLTLLDVCVEIPQVGIIRSLNVHVTGALFIWEYAKQNNFT